jgi:uncharacterized protein (DUF302 family)
VVATPVERNGITMKRSPLSVPDTVARLLELVGQKGLKVFAVIDQQAEARAVGLELRETILVLFGSPLAGTPVMDAVPTVAVDLPLRVLVWSDQGACTVSYTSPAALAARHSLPADLARTFDGIDVITDAVIAPSRPRAE